MALLSSAVGTGVSPRVMPADTPLAGTRHAVGKPSGSSALADKVRRMRVKSRAAVVPSIPAPFRIFFEISWSEIAAPVFCICASRQWTVGFLLDAACKAQGVRNPNATSSDDARRLHIYSTDVSSDFVARFTQDPSRANTTGALSTTGIATAADHCPTRSSSDLTIAGTADGGTSKSTSDIVSLLPFSSTLSELERSGALVDGGSLFVRLGLQPK